MTTFTKTQWFYPTRGEFPEYSGVYERDMSSLSSNFGVVKAIYSYWDENYGWLNSAPTVESAEEELHMSDYPLYSSWQDLPWRGIVKDAPDEL